MKIDYKLEIKYLEPFDLVGNKIVHTGKKMAYNMREFLKALRIIELTTRCKPIYNRYNPVPEHAYIEIFSYYTVDTIVIEKVQGEIKRKSSA